MALADAAIEPGVIGRQAFRLACLAIAMDMLVVALAL